MCAILYVSQVALASIPNCELVSLLIILFTIMYGHELFLVVTIFSLLEAFTYGFGLWVISYFYVWPILVLIVLLLRKGIKKQFLLWAVVSGMFGLSFGALFAIAYLLIDPSYAVTYFISGLLFDVWHAFCNFILMLILGKPISTLLEKIECYTK